MTPWAVTENPGCGVEVACGGGEPVPQPQLLDGLGLGVRGHVASAVDDPAAELVAVNVDRGLGHPLGKCLGDGGLAGSLDALVWRSSRACIPAQPAAVDGAAQDPRGPRWCRSGRCSASSPCNGPSRRKPCLRMERSWWEIELILGSRLREPYIARYRQLMQRSIAGGAPSTAVYLITGATPRGDIADGLPLVRRHHHDRQCSR